MILLDVQGLTAEFSTSRGPVRAVDNVTFSVAAGELVALVGESGCGKSATAQAIMGLIVPPAGRIVGGEVRFKGQDLVKLSRRQMRSVRGRGIAMIFQDPMTSLNPVMTIGDQMMEGARLHFDLGKKAARQRAVEYLDLVRIPAAASRLDAYPHQFSGGMRQRVMIAMALSCQPELILADEITTALDVTIQAQILDLLREVARETSTAVLFITHDLGVVAGVAERVNVMYAGHIIETGSTDDVFYRPQMPYTWGLLGSVPRVDQVRGSRLVPIAGQPPDLTGAFPGCRFAPRCPHSREVCEGQPPELREVDTDQPHRARCWGTRPASEGGWLAPTDREVS